VKYRKIFTSYRLICFDNRQEQLEHNGGYSLVIRCKWIKRLCLTINRVTTEKDEGRGGTEFTVG